MIDPAQVLTRRQLETRLWIAFLYGFLFGTGATTSILLTFYLS